MLILSRRSGESITIGDDIRITITRIIGNQVRIGIDAPKHVKILRDELTDHDKEDAGNEIV